MSDFVFRFCHVGVREGLESEHVRFYFLELPC